jgi:glycosyltransferase involved in cell wall biosynthesis
LASLYLSVVIPVYNESANVDKVTADAEAALGRHGITSYEILLVDDGSTDDSLSRMERLARRTPCTRTFDHQTNRGLGAALRTGFQNATGSVITWIPGDGQFDLADVLTGLPQLETKEIVVVIRNDRTGATRGFISTCFHGLIWLLFQFEATNLCGIYIIKRKTLEEIRPRSDNIFLNLEIPILCVRHGKPLGQITASVKPRLSGVSKVANPRTLVKNLFEMLKFRFGL